MNFFFLIKYVFSSNPHYFGNSKVSKTALSFTKCRPKYRPTLYNEIYEVEQYFKLILVSIFFLEHIKENSLME